MLPKKLYHLCYSPKRPQLIFEVWDRSAIGDWDPLKPTLRSPGLVARTDVIVNEVGPTRHCSLYVGFLALFLFTLPPLLLSSLSCNRICECIQMLGGTAQQKA
uniref:Glutathione peroxidase n=1 Tax=Parascaris univalens TaxID=6257 RepID=A0A915C5T2_PARUN